MHSIAARRASAALPFLASLLLAFPARASAASVPKYPWNVPDSNLRIVQKSPTDGVRTFATVQAAVRSITGASAASRYLVKIMPGRYVESVVLPAYVDLAGSGAEGTILEEAGTGPAIDAPGTDAFAVTGLTVVQHGNFAIRSAGAVAIRNVTIEGGADSKGDVVDAVTIDIADSSVTSAAGGNNGILLYGDEVTVRNTRLTQRSTGANIGVAVLGSVVAVLDSQITMANSGGSFAIMVDSQKGLVKDTTVTITATAPDWNFAIWTPTSGAASRIAVQGSRFEVSAPAGGVAAGTHGSGIDFDGAVIVSTGYGVFAGHIGYGFSRDLRINNSSITGGVLAITRGDATGSVFKVGNSMLAGGHDGAPGLDKVVGCHDAAFDPLPNL